MEPRKSWIVTTTYLPKIEANGLPLGYETILCKDKYYTRIKFESNQRPSRINDFIPSYQLEPKPWKVLWQELYHQNEGIITKDEKDWWYSYL